jgi:uncharacterized Zn finger protein (UPF0148 family)
MSDTLQIVQWCLEYSCVLRPAEAARVPGKAGQAVRQARTFADSPRKRQTGFGVFGDICVTSHIFVQGAGDAVPSIPYPVGGYRISPNLAAFDGPGAVLALCAGCPANTRPDLCGGCIGSFHVQPDGRELEQRLRRILVRLQLEEAYAAHFPATTPIWYGLWAQSPLTPGAVRLLRMVLGELVQEMAKAASGGKSPGHSATERQALADFLRAMEIAEERDLRLYVALVPPGHVDFGRETTFAHCPFCKAEAPVKRWMRKYPPGEIVCPVCQTRFSPAATSRSEPIREQDPDLRELLGQAEFEDLARRYLVAGGVTESQAARLIEETERVQAARRAQLAQQAEENNRRVREIERLTREVLCAGMTVHAGEAGPEKSGGYLPRLKAGDFVEFLRRGREQGLVPMALVHESVDGQSDRCWMQRGAEPAEEVLARWRSEGCDDLFYAMLNRA